MAEDLFLSNLSDQSNARSHTGIYSVVFLLAALVLVPLTIFVLTRPIRLKPAAAPNAVLGIFPNNGSLPVGGQINLFATLNTQENATDAVDIIIDYDSSKLKVYDTVKTDQMPYATVVGKQTNACGSPQNNLNGRIVFSGLAYDASLLPTPPPHNPLKTNGKTITLATIPLEAIAPGNAEVKILFDGPGVTTDSNVVETTTSQDLLSGVSNAVFTIIAGPGIPSVTPTPCPSTVTPTPTATPSQSPAPTLGDGTPAPGETLCSPQHDLDCDGLICDTDANILLANWRKTSAPYVCPAINLSCDPDFDNNGDVYSKEVSVLMSNWSGVDCD